METATQQAITYSEPQKWRKGKITSWNPEQEAGVVTITTLDHQPQFRLLKRDFPVIGERGLIRKGMMVEFSSPGGQEVSPGRRPEISVAKLIRD